MKRTESWRPILVSPAVQRDADMQMQRALTEHDVERVLDIASSVQPNQASNLARSRRLKFARELRLRQFKLQKLTDDRLQEARRV